VGLDCWHRTPVLLDLDFRSPLDPGDSGTTDSIQEMMKETKARRRMRRRTCC
jgi:hypothetical protein